ncbi:MAG TPA: beta-galactosidase trimerization domain-containing protein [Opitutaceae bacterium]|nr:beta-galactosidase trimerization domain-containing protein [Opitutaceae bacterium]
MAGPNPITRRDFLRTTAGAGAALSLADLRPGPAALAAALPPAGHPAPAWADRPMRWAQLTLVEDDPGRFNPGFWLDYFTRVRADAACLSAGGCVAFYPTEIPFHHRSAWLGDRDPFGDLVRGCRERGLVVAARTDPHALWPDAAAAHPEWVAVGADGRPRRHWASPDLWVACGLGPCNFDQLTAIHREIMTRYRPDAIFINRWSGSGMCWCASCRENFRAFAHADLPRTTDPRDPAYRQYLVWRQRRLFDLWQRWEDAVRAINPEACVVPNTGGGALSDLDMRETGGRAAMLAADRQARRGLMPPWANGKSAKEYRAALGRKPVIGIFSVGVEEPERWKDSVQREPELRLWALEGIANGMRPWFTKFSGTLHDERWLKPVERIYQWHQQNERYLRNEAPLARVGVVYSQQTAWFLGAERARETVEDAALGVYQALIEARIPFEMVHDRLLDAEHLRPFRLLILPNIAALSDGQCAQLRAFVAAGGGLLATSETSLYDETGARRKDFGLADLFGASFAGRVEGPMHNSYLRLHHATAAAGESPLLRGLEDAPRIINGVWRVDVNVAAPLAAPAVTLIPSYPDLPMEEVYPRGERPDKPQVFAREVGAGRVVYFPWDIDRTFWEVLAEDHGVLLRNAIAWAVNEAPPVVVAGPGVLDVTCWRQAASVTVHLVNLTNPMLLKGPIREFLPVGPQEVRLRLPSGRTPAAVRLLVAEREPEFSCADDVLTVLVPSILDHEVVAVDL